MDIKSFVKENYKEFKNSKFYPLIENTYGTDEIEGLIEVILSDKLTMGENVLKFEKMFANYLGTKYAVMVNSGSSANLLALAAATNFKRNHRLNPGDKVLVPSVCWSTSVWPIIQNNLIPVFLDVNQYTLNIDVEEIEKNIDEKTKGMVAVHIMGNSTHMDQLMKIVKKHNLVLIEDTCESLGSTYNNKYLGTFGDFGSFSFYFSHHITTIEGGMVCCNTQEDYELLKCLRAHGWSRNQSLENRIKYETQHPDIDNRFLFINIGYNLRPMEMQGKMGIIQLGKLTEKNNNRNYNRLRINDKIKEHPRNKGFLELCHHTNNCNPAWFSICLFLTEKYKHLYKDYLNYLTSCGIENRPIVTGNFVRQPVFKELNLNYEPTDFPGAEKVHECGFFIGSSCNILSNEKIEHLVNLMLDYDKIEQ